VSWATAATGIAFTIASTMASKSSVKPEPERAHGTSTCFTPHASHAVLGTWACR
jgi:hypothetical protein